MFHSQDLEVVENKERKKTVIFGHIKFENFYMAKCLLNHIPYDYTMEVRHRFKGLDLIDRVPDELWTEVCDIVQETGIKIIPMGKRCKKAKWLSEEALQIAVKRRELKSKGEKERYKHLNAEVQRIARRDKKAFLSDQCKERGKQQNGKD